jgi:hypothetical protein
MSRDVISIPGPAFLITFVIPTKLGAVLGL